MQLRIRGHHKFDLPRQILSSRFSTGFLSDGVALKNINHSRILQPWHSCNEWNRQLLFNDSCLFRILWLTLSHFFAKRWCNTKTRANDLSTPRQPRFTDGLRVPACYTDPCSLCTHPNKRYITLRVSCNTHNYSFCVLPGTAVLNLKKVQSMVLFVLS